MGMGNVCHTFERREPASGQSGEHKKGAAIIPIAVTSLAISQDNNYGKEKRIKCGDFARKALYATWKDLNGTAHRLTALFNTLRQTVTSANHPAVCRLRHFLYRHSGHFDDTAHCAVVCGGEVEFLLRREVSLSFKRLYNLAVHAHFVNRHCRYTSECSHLNQLNTL